MRSYLIKDTYIGSADNEILRYKQTDRQTNILLLYTKILKTHFLFVWYSQMVNNSHHVVWHVPIVRLNYNTNTTLYGIGHFLPLITEFIRGCYSSNFNFPSTMYIPMKVGPLIGI